MKAEFRAALMSPNDSQNATLAEGRSVVALLGRLGFIASLFIDPMAYPSTSDYVPVNAETIAQYDLQPSDRMVLILQIAGIPPSQAQPSVATILQQLRAPGDSLSHARALAYLLTPYPQDDGRVSATLVGMFGRMNGVNDAIGSALSI